MSNISKQVTIKKDEKTEITYFSKQCPIDDSIPYDTVNGLTVSYANTNLETSQFISIPTYIDMDSALGDMFPTNGRPNPCHCNGVPLVSKVPDDFKVINPKEVNISIHMGVRNIPGIKIYQEEQLSIVGR